MWETNIPLPKFEHEIIWNSWIHEQKGQKKWMKKHPSHPPKCSWRSNRPGRCNVKPPWSRQCSPERPPHSNGVHPTSHIHMSWMYNKCMNQIESRAISRFVHQLLTSSCFNCLAPPEKAKFQWIGFKHLIFIFIFHHLPSSSIIFHHLPLARSHYPWSSPPCIASLLFLDLCRVPSPPQGCMHSVHAVQSWMGNSLCFGFPFC